MVLKKMRDQHNLFLAEGPKIIGDLMEFGLRPHFLVGTHQWIPPAQVTHNECETIVLTEEEFRKLSFLKTPQHVLGLFPKPEYPFNNSAINDSLVLALDGIQDPGNMGTIIRLADWFGINHLICSHDTVDIFNPKVVQASMGAVVKVAVHYTDLPSFCKDYRASSGNPVYGTFMNGNNLFNQQLRTKGIIVMGNEGNGIRPETEKQVTERITIPDFSQTGKISESLNVGVATAIVCAEFRRQGLSGSCPPSMAATMVAHLSPSRADEAIPPA